jgi:hypothetical protein
MDSSVSSKDETWFLRVCRHISNAVHPAGWRLNRPHRRSGCISKKSTTLSGCDPWFSNPWHRQHRIRATILLTLKLTLLRPMERASPYHLSKRSVGAPVKSIFRPPNKGGPAKNLDTKSERLTPSCTVTSAWYERVNLYSRQIIMVEAS